MKNATVIEKQQSDKIQFPPHFKLSVNEAATAARLVRLMRERRTYWLRYFVEWLLREEACTGVDLEVEAVEKYLLEMKNLRNWRNWLSNAKKANPAFEHHPAMAWLPGDPGDDEEDEAESLNRLYSLPSPADVAAPVSNRRKVKV